MGVTVDAVTVPPYHHVRTLTTTVSAVDPGCLPCLEKNYVFLLSVILVEKLYVFVQLLQKYVRVKIKNSCLHNITGVDMGSNTTRMENNDNCDER